MEKVAEMDNSPSLSDGRLRVRDGDRVYVCMRCTHEVELSPARDEGI